MTNKNAIILAAGFGSRMLPLTNFVPKPLVEVNGVSFIERTINNLIEIGIEDIYIVVGHLKNMFEPLVNKYSNLHLIENPDYNTSNNISSIYYVRKYLKNSFIIEGDIFMNENILLSYQDDFSYYSGIKMDDTTNEWSFKLDNNIIIDTDKKNGIYDVRFMGVSYWKEEDSMILKKLVEKHYESGNKNIFWDDITLFLNKDEFKIKCHMLENDSILEIDTLDELIEIDNSYEGYKNEKR